MTRLRCRVARTAGEIADAQRVRWIVYGEEERLLPPHAARERREIDARDRDRDTVHVIVYAGEEPVGTVRLLPARPGGRLELEASFQLAVPRPACVAGEVTRYCVVRAHRCTPVARMLHLALAAESRGRGITHWFAAANLETDSADDAALVYEVVRARNLLDPIFHAEPRRPSPGAGRRRCFSADDLRQARAGGAAGLHLPRVIALFMGKMGARCMGAPAYDPYFNVFALPIVADVPPAVVAPQPSIRPFPPQRAAAANPGRP